MKILFLSDTHGQHRKLTNLPAADVLIHSGDVSCTGTEDEVLDFVEWLCGLNYAHKIFIGGNHDTCLYGAGLDDLPDDCHYLCNNGVTINGVRFWGVPYFVMDDIAGAIPQQIAQIPPDTDIVITHCPPFGILDKSAFGANMGDRDLKRRIAEIKPRYHLFGHVHEAYGTFVTPTTTYINGSLPNEKYEITNQPIIIEI